MDDMRKAGINDIKKKLNTIIMNNSLSTSMKMGRLDNSEEIREYMMQCLMIKSKSEEL